MADFSRRTFLVGVAALLPGLRAAGATKPSTNQEFAALEADHGGRLGVAAFENGTQRRIEYRAAERFPMCSTFKFLLVAAILARVDSHQESLNRSISYSAADLLAYAHYQATLGGGMHDNRDAVWGGD